MMEPNPKPADRRGQAQLVMGNAKIMMVDDEPINMDVLRIHLESEGYNRFVTVVDSREALDTLRREEPDVLLLDLVMPEVSGFEILEAIQADDKLRSTPVVVLTSSDDSDTKLKALNLGATDFLAKPIDASELALRLRNTLTTRAWQERINQIDSLTGLPNRLYFTSLLEARIAADLPSDMHSPLAVININRFKSINDSLGPARGDQVLVGFKDRLLSVFDGGVLRMDDVLFDFASLAACDQTCVARLGGDRFAFLLPPRDARTAQVSLTTLVKQLLEAMEQAFTSEGQDVFLELSIGITTLHSDSGSVRTAINDAETAMLHAKRRSDTSFAFYSEQMDARARELLSLENGLRTAVDNGEIFLVYQPTLGVKSGQIKGAEALVRWMHPEFGLISPVNFIPMAEDSGMIVSIGEWVLRESCRQAVDWQQRGHPDFSIAVNVSMRQLHEPDFLQTVQSALMDSGLPPESLTLELTENMIMENAESNVVKLLRLNALGVKLSIDDFGTGYSSLSYLQRFPIDQLKIDRSFIMEINSATDRAPIVKAVISLAHDLGLEVVAEGVETHHQLARIVAFRCDEYQGYLCSKPVPAEEFLCLLEGKLDKSA